LLDDIRINPSHFCASFVQVELPPHWFGFSIPVRTGRIKLALPQLFFGGPLFEDRAAQDRTLPLGNVV